MKIPLRRQTGLTIFDAVLTLCLAGVLIGVILPKYQRIAQSAQEEALKAGLANIRISIQLFRVVNGRAPKTLREMISENVMLPARTGRDPFSGSLYRRKYLITKAVDAGGNIIDAFGNPYLYDPVRGEVKSSTQGYETW